MNKPKYKIMEDRLKRLKEMDELLLKTEYGFAILILCISIIGLLNLA